MSAKNFNMSFDTKTKEQFAEILAGYGLTVPQAFKLLANQVIHTGVLPLSFDWQAREIPNSTTIKAIEELESGKGVTYKTSDEALHAIQAIANEQR